MALPLDTKHLTLDVRVDLVGFPDQLLGDASSNSAMTCFKGGLAYLWRPGK